MDSHKLIIIEQMVHYSSRNLEEHLISMVKCCRKYNIIAYIVFRIMWQISRMEKY